MPKLKRRYNNLLCQDRTPGAWGCARRFKAPRLPKGALCVGDGLTCHPATPKAPWECVGGWKTTPPPLAPSRTHCGSKWCHQHMTAALVMGIFWYPCFIVVLSGGPLFIHPLCQCVNWINITPFWLIPLQTDVYSNKLLSYRLLTISNFQQITWVPNMFLQGNIFQHFHWLFNRSSTV